MCVWLLTDAVDEEDAIVIGSQISVLMVTRVRMSLNHVTSSKPTTHSLSFNYLDFTDSVVSHSGLTQVLM